MVLMALDHVRDFFSNVIIDPVDLEKTWPALFLTRWITHYCAPTFLFLAGTGAFFAGTRRTKPELCRFLWTRGLWLVFLELTWVRFGWRWELRLDEFNGGSVIWAIGWSMVCLSALIFLPVKFVGGFGVAMIVLHNAFDRVAPESFGGLSWLWRVLHAGGMFKVPWGGEFSAGYPLIPWIGVMAAGYAFGTIFAWEAGKRRRFLMLSGMGLVMGFVLLRATNLYGDASPWSRQKDFAFTIFSFLNCTKYPPSLMYLMMTLGPAMLALAFLERPLWKWARPVLVFGRVPLFYYLLHLPLIHGAAIVAAKVEGNQAAVKFLTGAGAPGPLAGFGYSLPGVYLVWMLVILALYPVCAWFSGVKERSRSAWLSYL